MPDIDTSGDFNRAPTAEQLAFFESKIRPLLVERCYECHSAQAAEVGGGLLLDSQRGLVKGGDNGPPIVPREPNDSLLISAIRHGSKELQMPPDEKLDEHQIQDFVTWIEMGAPDPRSEDTVAARKAKLQVDWAAAREFLSRRPRTGPDATGQW